MGSLGQTRLLGGWEVIAEVIEKVRGTVERPLCHMLEEIDKYCQFQMVLWERSRSEIQPHEKASVLQKDHDVILLQIDDGHGHVYLLVVLGGLQPVTVVYLHLSSGLCS